MTFIATVADDEAEGAVKHAYDETRALFGGVYETTRMLSPWPMAPTSGGRLAGAVSDGGGLGFIGGG